MTNTDQKTAQILLIIGGLAVIPLAVAWKGYVLSIMWAWFMVPALHLPVIGVAESIGLMFVITLFTMHLSKRGEDNAEAFVFAFASPLIVLFCGYILTFFMPVQALTG